MAAIWRRRESVIEQLIRLLCTESQSEYSLLAAKLRWLDICQDEQVIRWCRAQASSHYAQRVINWFVNETSISTVAQAGAQYSAAEWTKPRVAVRNVVTLAPQLVPASRLKRPTRVVSFLRCDSRCWRYVKVLSNFTPR